MKLAILLSLLLSLGLLVFFQSTHYPVDTLGAEREDNAEVPPSLSPTLTVDREVMHVSPNISISLEELINNKLFVNGGREKSASYLDNLTLELISSKKKAPFEAPFSALNKVSSVDMPSRDYLWTLSIEGMRYVADIMNLQGEWLRNHPTSFSTPPFDEIQSAMRANSLKLPPEAIAMGLTRLSWNSIIADYPILDFSLGRVREGVLLEYAQHQEDIWHILTATYQATLELDLELEMSGDLPRDLAPYYPPLLDLVLKLDALKLQYRDLIAGELIAVGLDVELQ